MYKLSGLYAFGDQKVISPPLTNSAFSHGGLENWIPYFQ